MNREWVKLITAVAGILLVVGILINIAMPQGSLVGMILSFIGGLGLLLPRYLMKRMYARRRDRPVPESNTDAETSYDD